MAVTLASFFAQIHHISAYRFWGHGDFCEVMLVVTEVHCKEHLQTQRETQLALRVKETPTDTERSIVISTVHIGNLHF